MRGGSYAEKGREISGEEDRCSPSREARETGDKTETRKAGKEKHREEVASEIRSRNRGYCSRLRRQAHL